MILSGGLETKNTNVVLSPIEIESLRVFEAELVNAQEQIVFHQNAYSDRNCVNEAYHYGLIVKWREEEELLTARIERIRNDAKLRNEREL